MQSASAANIRHPFALETLLLILKLLLTKNATIFTQESLHIGVVIANMLLYIRFQNIRAPVFTPQVLMRNPKNSMKLRDSIMVLP